MAAEVILNACRRTPLIPASDLLPLITAVLTVNIEYLHFAYPGLVSHVNQYGIRKAVDQSPASVDLSVFLVVFFFINGLHWKEKTSKKRK